VSRVTEGELKADVASVLSRVRTLSVAGVGAWMSALPVLRELGAARVVLAFDADAWRKPAVARALCALALALQGEPGVEAAMERWDEAEGKGIDDVLARGGRPELVEGPDVQRLLEALLPGGPAEAAAVGLGGVDVAGVRPAPVEAAMGEGRRLLGRWGGGPAACRGAGGGGCLGGTGLAGRHGARISPDAPAAGQGRGGGGGRPAGGRAEGCG
jgi:hypothetical protein